MEHTLSLLLQNQSGALVRVAGLFAERHCNIDSLSVNPTTDPTLSQLTMVVHGTPAMVDQIVQHLFRLIDVIDVHVLSPVNNTVTGLTP